MYLKKLKRFDDRACRIGFGRPKPPVEALPVSVDDCPKEAFNETTVNDVMEFQGLFLLI